MKQLTALAWKEWSEVQGYLWIALGIFVGLPVIGEMDWILAAYIALKLFVWLCPADVVREHVGQIAHGQ